MPEVREAFEAVTAPPEPGARERQYRRQRRAVLKRRVGAFAVAATIVIGIGVLTFDGGDHAPQIADDPTIDAPAPREDDTYLLSLGDGTMTPLHSPIDGWSYRFSPDGSQVVFAAVDADGNQLIYRMNPDGAMVTALTTTGFLGEWAFDVDEPAWSPDGEWLVISGTDAHNGRRSLYLLSPEGYAPPRSGIGFVHQASEPTWSPDGRHIAFTETGEDGPEIQIVRTHRYSGGTSITTRSPETLLEGALSFSWSIDGSRIVFVPSDTRIVSTADADGANVRTIANTPGANPSWSPNGASIAYDDLSSGRIAIYDVTSGATRHLDVNACMQGWADAATLLVTTECEG